ncbi:MAG: LacI family DNA-binding transcriptional regulator [Clostridia bacterium]|nr:LacI family DNA-binding transcriptional regulator [Clostridia bacterium]
MATIKEIARACGVSEGTVDRALHARAGIREDTRRRILETAEQLAYTPNRVAQSLATGRTRTLGIVCFDLINNCFTRLIDAIEAEAKANGYFINLILTHKDPRHETDGLRYLAERRVDGIGLFPVGKGDAHAAFVRGLGIPVITVFNRLDPGIPHVGIDDRGAMRDAVLYAAARGYEQIVLVSPRLGEQLARGLNAHTMEQRRLGYAEGLAAAGLRHGPVVAEGKDFGASLREVDFSRRTALLCVSDAYAMLVQKHLRGIGRSVPRDVGVMGFDHVDRDRVFHPALTTVEYHVETMGRQVVRSLCRVIEGEAVDAETLLPHTIVEGETL